MRTRRKRILIGVGTLAGVCAGLLVAMFVARRSYMERERRAVKAAAGRGPPPGSGVAPVFQLPNITGRSERDGVVVILSNDTPNRRVVIDPAEEQLVVPYASVPAGRWFVRSVSLRARTLAPGEAMEPFFIPTERRWGSVRAEFAHRDRQLVVRTEVTIP